MNTSALAVLDGRAQRIGGEGMDRSSSHAGKGSAGLSSSVRAEMEAMMGKLDITDEEATPLAIDDVPIGVKPKWMLAGKIMYRNLFHIQTISNALRLAWGNPRGLVNRLLGDNMFVAEFENQRDGDRVWKDRYGM